MLTLIKWNGLKEKVLPEMAKEKGRKRDESDETFAKRMLMSWKGKRFTLPEDGE